LQKTGSKHFQSFQFSPNALVGLTGGVVGGAASEATMALLSGGDIGEGALYGGISGGISGGIMGGLTGGLVATREGRNFWNGNVDRSIFITKEEIFGGALPPGPYQNNSTINPSTGGFIETTQDFMNFMGVQPNTNPFEVAGVSLRDGRYFVEPWDHKTVDQSINDFDAIPGYKNSDVVSQYHTHPNGNGPSSIDAYVSRDHHIPVHTISPNGVIWKVQIPSFQLIPIHTFYNGTLKMPYGSIIYTPH
jgi:proteasome lid subunit RPN8/RPN11